MTKRIKKIIPCAAMAGLLSIFVLGCTCICAKQTSTDGRLVILQEPQSQFVALNSSVSFSVVAMHTGPPTTNAIAYQWRFNTNNIAGATSSIYSIAHATFSNVGAYSVLVSGSTLLSDPAYLSVFSTSLSGNGGTLSQVIDAFGNGTASCVAGTWKTYSFPTNAPYYAPPTGTTKLSIDTFDTRNGTWDTAARVLQRAPFYSPTNWCNDNALAPPTYNSRLSQVTNVTTRASSYYQFIIYVNGTPPLGTQFYLNYTFY